MEYKRVAVCSLQFGCMYVLRLIAVQVYIFKLLETNRVLNHSQVVLLRVSISYEGPGDGRDSE